METFWDLGEGKETLQRVINYKRDNIVGFILVDELEGDVKNRKCYLKPNVPPHTSTVFWYFIMLRPNT